MSYGYKSAPGQLMQFVHSCRPEKEIQPYRTSCQTQLQAGIGHSAKTHQACPPHNYEDHICPGSAPRLPWQPELVGVTC